MPMLALNGTTIPLAYAPLEAEVRRFGDEAEAWDGTLLTRRRTKKREWVARTKYLPAADAATLLTVLEATPPHAATGDLAGSISVIVTVVKEISTTLAGLARFRAFEIRIREE